MDSFSFRYFLSSPQTDSSEELGESTTVFVRKCFLYVLFCFVMKVTLFYVSQSLLRAEVEAAAILMFPFLEMSMIGRLWFDISRLAWLLWFLA